MNKLALAISLLLVSTPAVFAGDDHDKKRHHDAHEHGSGKLSVVAFDGQLMIEIETPSHDMVGFEHKPTNDKQKAKVKEAIKLLKKTESNIKLPGEANCVASNHKVETALMEEEHHDEHGHHDQDDHDHDEDTHSEFHIVYNFNCKNVDKLNYIEVLSFGHFKNMGKLSAQGVTDKGQYSATLTPESPRFNLE